MWLASGPRARARGGAGPRDSEGVRRERSRGSRRGEEEGKEEGDADEWDRTGSATEGEHTSGVERRQGGPRLSASAGESTAGSGEVRAAPQVRLTGGPRWVTRTTRDAGLRVMLG